MTAKDLAVYERHLRKLAERLRGELTELRGEALQGPNADMADWPEGAPPRQADPGSYEAAEGVALTVLGTEEHILDEVEAALRRIEMKTFGRCETCGKAIRRERLRAVPYARTCVTCARRQAE